MHSSPPDANKWLMRRAGIEITLTTDECESLESLVRTRTAPQRARLVLPAAQGLTNTAVSQEAGLSRSIGSAAAQALCQRAPDGWDDRAFTACGERNGWPLIG